MYIVTRIKLNVGMNFIYIYLFSLGADNCDNRACAVFEKCNDNILESKYYVCSSNYKLWVLINKKTNKNLKKINNCSMITLFFVFALVIVIFMCICCCVCPYCVFAKWFAKRKIQVNNKHKTHYPVSATNSTATLKEVDIESWFVAFVF
jgi:hypothetical protein